MDRTIVAPEELLLDTDLLKLNRNVMIGLAKLSEVVLGTTTQINGLDCTPTSPASMSVLVGAGEIYQVANIDNTPYGTLPADTTHQILKQGIVLDTQTFACPAPTTSGYAIDYLIQVTFTEQDIGTTDRPFYNSADPDGIPPLFLSVNQTRQDLCNVQIKPGTAALAGTQVTPSPDASYVGAWVITVQNGQTTITSDNIVTYQDAPFITMDEAIQPNENLIIGGDFGTNPWQRGTLFTPAIDGTYTADNIRVATIGSCSFELDRNTSFIPSVAQSGVHSNASLEISAEIFSSTHAAGDLYEFRYYVEGYDFQKIAQRPFTLSFWTYTNKPGTYHVWLKNAGFDRSYVIPYQITAANTWEKQVLTVLSTPASGTWNYSNGTGLIISWILANGTSWNTTTTNQWISANLASTSSQTNFMDAFANKFLIDLIKLEAGSVETPFSQGSISDVIQQCERYYEKSYSLDVPAGTIATNSGALTCQISSATADIVGLNAPLRSAKRTDSPSITFYSPVTGAAGYVRNVTQDVDVQVSSVNFTSQNCTGYPTLASAGTAGDIYSAHFTAVDEFP